MNDLAARLAWSVTPNYRDANHYPDLAIDRPRVSAAPGEVLTLRARTKDPDGDAVRVEWLKFNGPGAYPRDVKIDQEGLNALVQVPADAKPGDKIHLVAKTTDDGKLPMTRYARVIVTVR